MGRADREVKVTFTAEEAWEVINILGAGFIPGEGNEVVDAAAVKLRAAYLRAKGMR